MPPFPTSTPLEDFLAGSSSDTSTGELIQQVGLFGSLGGLTLALGLVVLLGAVHRGPAREVSVLLRVIAVASGIALVGAAVEVAGLATIDDVSWWDALRSSAGSAPMLRLLAAALIVGGLFEHTAPVVDDGEPDGADAGLVRWVPAGASATAYAGLALAVASFWFDGHTTSRGVQGLHAAVNAVHVVSGSIWFGGVVGLAIVAVLRRAGGPSMAPLVVRFSSVATMAVVLVSLAGVAMAATILDTPGDVTGTVWGRVLIAKVVAVALVGVLGGYNRFVVVPALDRGDRVERHLAHAKVTIVVEAVLLLVVVVFTVVLTTSSIV